MSTKRIHRKIDRTPEEQRRLDEIRERFQRERSGLDDLIASGDITDVVSQGEYLSQQEFTDLNRIVTMYLDYAEDQARRQQTMTMAGWVSKLNAFLEFHDRSVLQHAGKVQKKVADHLAVEQFESYRAEQRRIEAKLPISDFDRFIEDLRRKQPPGEDADA